MSKLADRIRKAGRQEAARLGFATVAAPTPLPTMLTIVRLASNDANKASEAVQKGADAVIFEGADAGKVKDQANKADQTPLGARADNTSRRDIASLREAGTDFVVLDMASAMAEALLEEKIGLVLFANAGTDDTTLRLLSDLGLDAMIVPPLDGPLTVERLLALRRISALARTPLLTEVSVDAESSRLQTLRDSGVAGVIVDGSALGKLGRLRETIAALPPRGRKRQERGEAMLPAQAPVAAPSDDEYEDDE